MAANNRQITTHISIEDNTLLIKTERGEFLIGAGTLESGIYNHAALHGLKQKIVDAAAIGAGATITDKYEAMKEVVERLTGPEPTWNKSPGSGGGARGGLLFNALCRLYPDKETDAIRVYHDKLDRSQQAALRKNTKIAAIVEEIKAERMDTSGVDTDELLNGLEGI